MPRWSMAVPASLLRSTLNWVNGTTAVGLLLAGVTGVLGGRVRLRRAPGGVLVAEGYRFPVPQARCFTVGNLVFCRGTAHWLLHPDQRALLAHETRHVTQYACLGPLFFPLYALAAGASWLVCADAGCRNVFEQWAGLRTGGYLTTPLRPWADRLLRVLISRAGSSPSGPPDGSPSPR